MTRENRVPYYQRLFQRRDGLRHWEKVSRNILSPPIALSTGSGSVDALETFDEQLGISIAYLLNND